MSTSLGFPAMHKILSPRAKGVAKIEHYEVTKLDVLRELMHGGPAEVGKVAILRVAGRTMMSDTLHERQTNYEIKRTATGNMLIAGLGIGMILHPILAKENVKHVTVLEKEQDVIDLVAPTLPQEKLTVICADVFDWKPPTDTKYDVIYFDIWADGAADLTKKERHRLRCKYRKYKAQGGAMFAWKPMVLR